MAEEVEIKLRVPPGALKTVERLDWLKALAQGPAKRKALRSVYFDTPKKKLNAKGFTLRVRHAGKKRLQTVKAESAGMFARREWECEIASDKPDLSALPPLGKIGVKKLRPVFETAVSRLVMPLAVGGTVMELALDRGTVKAGRRTAPISEIELELKDGDPRVLAGVAGRLAEAVPAAFEVFAKSERGYALARGVKTRPLQARPIALETEMAAADAFRAIAKEALRHLAANEAAVLAGDGEGLHQMRVGLRRLRAALSLFKEVLADSESAALKTELKWLSGELAPARDLDVFLHGSIAPLVESTSEMAVLESDMAVRRDGSFARVRVAVESARYRRLVLAVALWLADGVWARNDDLLQRARRDRPVLSFAREILQTRQKKIFKKARRLKSLTPLERHKLRIAIKKLRYAGEFFASLFARRKARRKKFLARLARLQDALGRLNDFAVHRKMADAMVGNAGRSRKEAFALGLVEGREQIGEKRLLAAAGKAGAHLKRVPSCWA